MTPATKLLITVLGSAAEIAAFVAWKGYGVEAAGNVLLFWLWFCAGVGTVLWFAPVSANPYEQPTRLRAGINFATPVAIVGGLAWFGHFAVASFYTFGLLGMHAYRQRAAEACLAGVKDND